MVGGMEENRTATNHFMVGAGFLVLGSQLQVLALMALRFDDIFPISYGRLEPMANLVMMIGFAAISLFGGVYYVLPRLTGTRLWGNDLAAAGLIGTTVMVFVGVAAVFFGLGDGRLPLGAPWWFHVPMVFLLAIPALVTIGTISRRTEDRGYVTLWFALGGLIWLPLLYLAYFSGDLPYFHSVAIAYNDVFFSAGFVTMFLFTVGTGLFYYTLVKELDVALASRQLAIVGFWSLGFAAVWWGTSQLMFGPSPSWLSGVGAALGLAFPVGALANAANASLTIDGSWEELREKPEVSSGLIGLYLGVGVAVVAALAGFRSIAAVVANTSFWESIEYAALSGVGVLLVAGVSLGALPRLTGRQIHTVGRARTFIRLTVIGTVGVMLFLGAAGVVSGYSWIAGSNSSAYVDAGEGWAFGAGTSVDTLTLIAVGFALITFLGHLWYVGTILGTMASGTATTQEIIVDKVSLDE